MREIPYARQEITVDDVAAVVAALHEPMLTQGPLCERFETRFADAVGARFAVAFSSGTAALHGAYAAAGISADKGVLTTPTTFAATANAALYLQAPVRFVDVDLGSALLDPVAVERADARGVRAVVPVHFGGAVADMESLSRIAHQRGWIVIEDAAHALGATYVTRDGKTHRVGACAHAAMCCFSFHPVKHITTGEGGMVTTNDAALAHALRLFRTHGVTRTRSDLTRDDGPWYYEQQSLGYNYRITDVQCALGISQLTRLSQLVARRRAIAAEYDAAFRDVDVVRPLKVPAWSRSSYHLYVVRVPADLRRPLYDALSRAGIHSNVHYLPVYQHPYYRANGFRDFALPHADAHYTDSLSLPMYAGLMPAEVARVIDVVQAFAQAHAPAGAAV